MNEDTVLQQVRAAREKYAKAHGYNAHAIVEDLRIQDERGDWPVVRLVPRRPTDADALPSEPVPAQHDAR